MRGKVFVTVQNNHVQYKFTLNRNITILRGDSATGKTTLIDMVRQYEFDRSGGVSIICEKECRVIGGERWKEQLSLIRDSIVFIDEGNRFLKTPEFAAAVGKSSNYYVIATRDFLPALPYSVDEIYGIANKTKGYGQIKRLYSGFKKLYFSDSSEKRIENYDLVIVEDSNAGYTFFRSALENKKCKCISAKGKSNIAKTILKAPQSTRILVIADGAAFGPEMESVLKAGYLRKVEIYLPESFEWLVLKSGLVEGSDIQEILADPSEYIESREYFSWERFFTALLTERTKDGYLAYNKKKLNPAYLREYEKTEILKETPLGE